MDKRHWLHRFASHLIELWMDYLEVVVVVAWAIVGILFELQKSKPGWIVFSIAAAMSVVLVVARFKRRKTMQSLEATNVELSEKVQRYETELEEARSVIVDLFNTQLAHMFHALQFTGNERITVYRHDVSNFIPVARYTTHNTYVKLRRKRIPDDQGFVAKAWNHHKGEFHITGLPPGDKLSKYCSTVTGKCNIPIEELRSMRMRCSEYYGLCVYNAEGLTRKAVIVFESRTNGTLVVDKIKAIMEAEGKRLTYFVETVEPNFNSVAEDKGF